MDSHLVRAIVDMAIFLEHTHSDHLNEDVAVAAMEQMAAELQQMNEDDRGQLSQRILPLSVLYEMPQRRFVQDLPNALGIA